jgi:anti-sigma regulatory factor (Ser/Thr protein kinase)
VEVIAQHRVQIEDDTQVGEARRVGAALSRTAGLSATEAGRVAIVVNELGSNVRKHAQRGEMLLSEIPNGVEVLAIDNGPGMDVDASLRDGLSTAGTRGEGLGAVKRQAQVFDAWSAPGRGTVVLARICKEEPSTAAFQIGGVSLPVRGEVESGDAWDVDERRSGLRLLVVDGLGHGPTAARAAKTAVESFRSSGKLPAPEAVMHSIHAALRPTRGAAVAVAELDLISRTVRFAGVGNIAATVETAGAAGRGLLSHNGIAGHEARRIQEFSIPLPARAVLVMHSDGLTSHWKLAGYSGLHVRHAAVIAGLLYRDFRRANDDVTVVVVKEP